MMDIPINAEVLCADGPCGRSTTIIVNPTTGQVTHLVVQEKRFISHPDHLVPIDQVVESTPHLIRLHCTWQELAKLEPFLEIEFVPFDVPGYSGSPFMMWPYTLPGAVVSAEREHLPPSELAMHPGARVEATDGHVGQVDEFLVDPTDDHITHLALRKGHLWGQKDVIIAVSQIDRLEEDIVYLKLDKQSIEALPAIPVRQRRTNKADRQG